MAHFFTSAIARLVDLNGEEAIINNVSSKTVAIAVLASLPILSLLNFLHAKSSSIFCPRSPLRFLLLLRRRCGTPVGRGELTKEEDDGVDIQCVICLCDVCEGQLYRLLPDCNHGFHVNCIDVWLRTHSTCPLCRCPVPCTPAKTSGNIDEDDGYLIGAGAGAVFSNFRCLLEHVCKWFVNPLGFDQLTEQNYGSFV
ncbi:hypothetical protein M9H77_00745 [Catharanthus roseus]|uniref:Uncharacterized protein n=1 Tax=Catharanthus roseus TaxID=4058 RepID=A0ACC0C3Z3_CATRO|nr:hypothetical protein M9H77_00745 [Catharanthus roseus]